MVKKHYAQTMSIVDYILKLYKEPITFLGKDLVGVELPHDDALIIILNVSRSEIWRVLIDMGSSYSITFMSAFKQRESTCGNS